MTATKKSVPKEPRRSREVSRAETRSKLLESARVVFAQEGYEHASIDRIAANAGYSKGAFYANFSTKEEMFLEILQEHISGQRAVVRATLENLTTPDEIIDAISNWSAKRDGNDVWIPLLIELLRHARHNKELSAKYGAIFLSQWKELGESLLRIFPDPKSAPASPEAIGALVMELTFGNALSFVSSVQAGQLVHLALTALRRAAEKIEE